MRVMQIVRYLGSEEGSGRQHPGCDGKKSRPKKKEASQEQKQILVCWEQVVRINED